MKFSSFRALALFISLIFITSCNTNQFKVDVSNIPVPKVEIKDYGKALFSLNRDSLDLELSVIQNEFSLFLGTEALIDEQIIQLSFYVNDPFLNELFSAYQTVYPTLEQLENNAANAFQHLFYYFPDTKMPEMYSYISGIQDPIIFQDNILVIGLDNYLGADCEIYARLGTPRYKIRTMSPNYVLRDIFSAFSLQKISAPAADGVVLDFMIYEAKKLFFIKSMIPTIEDSILLNYTSEQLDWLNDKEKALWGYYIQNELLFKSDYESLKKFINDGPFTSVLGNNSPPRTGVWLGYKILLSYAKNNEVSLSDILSNNNARDILNKSKYRPRR